MGILGLRLKSTEVIVGLSVNDIKINTSSLGYINKIGRNLLNIKKSKLRPLYADLKSANCVVCGGSGRSLYSLNAAMSQIALSRIGWRNKVVVFLGEICTKLLGNLKDDSKKLYF